MPGHSPVSMRYDINIIFAFIAVGVILILGGGGSPIWGYTWLSLSLMALLFTVISQLIINGHSGKETQGGWLGLAKTIWTYGMSTLPVSLMFILVSWYASQYLQYEDIIERGNLPQEYYSFSNASTMLLVFELIALYNMITTIMTENQLNASQNISPSSSKKKTYLELVQTKDETLYYGFLIFNFIMAGFMHVILSCFITDG